MEGQESGNSSAYISWKNAPQDISLLCQSSKWQGWDCTDMGGVDRLDQKISSYMIGHHSRKWWWPVFRFCLDLSVSNAYQLYRQLKCSEGECKLDLLGFRRSIVDTYYRYLGKLTTTNIFPTVRKLSKVSDEAMAQSIWHNQSLDRQGKATEMLLMSENHTVLLWKMQCWTPSRLSRAVSHQEVT